MMYKKLAIFLSVMMISMSGYAQTQQGYVKTKGRLNSNGSVIAGTHLSGTTITVKGGNAVTSGSNGTFSLTIPNNNYYLQSVQKQGYVLTDPDVLAKQYAYSKNPLVLVLETPSQQADDQLAAEKKIRRTLQRQLQEKEDEIESLKEQHKLTEEEHRKQLQKIYANQEDNEKLISEMANRYSKIDFDEVDEFNRRISRLILDGKLTEADSLINSKGDINSRVATLHKHQNTNAQEERELRKKQKKLEKSKAITQKELEELAQDCYNKFEIFKLQHLNDSAANYLELRTSLDTTNVIWILELGDYYFHYVSNNDKAMEYYHKALNTTNMIGDSTFRSDCITNIASVYSDCNQYDKAMEYYRIALSERLSLYGEDSEQVAASFNNIGAVYVRQRDFEKGKDAIEHALNIYTNIPNEKKSNIALCYNNLGFIYSETEEPKKSLECYEKALNMYLELYGDNHPDVALTYNNIGCIYSDNEQEEKALEYYKKSLEIKRKVYGNEHPDVALSLSNIGSSYVKLGYYNEAIALSDSAIIMFQKFQKFGNLSVAICHNQLGYTYSRMKDYSNAIKNYTKAIEITQSVFGEEHYDVALYYNNISKLYYNMGEYKQALEIMQKSLRIYTIVLGEQHKKTEQTRKVVEMLQQRVTEKDGEKTIQ